MQLKRKAGFRPGHGRNGGHDVPAAGPTPRSFKPKQIAAKIDVAVDVDVVERPPLDGSTAGRRAPELAGPIMGQP